VDILINNAGAIPGGTLADINEERWRQAWELKLFGYINLTRIYLAAMEKQGHGIIGNIIGMAGAAPRAEYICGSNCKCRFNGIYARCWCYQPQTWSSCIWY
jgi:NADP-dependent 3-hydroxy acid dehydrogenase YdfG